jgi:hypothetical protein
MCNHHLRNKELSLKAKGLLTQADRREENAQSAVSCIERGSKEAEKIRKSVYSILQQEQREQQPLRKQDMER